MSWQIAGNADQTRGVRQAAYRITVASSPELCQSGNGDLWDSGKVTGESSTQIAYAGKPLLSRMQCFWKVHVWLAIDHGAERKQIEADSGQALWTMGLLETAAWHAQWIGSPTDDMIEPAPLLRNTFSLKKEIKRASVYVSGLGYYEMHLNGAKVGDHVLDPKVTRYDRRVPYVTYDVTRQLRKGANAIAVILGNGWYNYHVPNPWNFHLAPWRAKPKLLLELHVEYADGTSQTVLTDSTWKYSTGPVVFDGFLNGEKYDARLEKAGWDTATYDDSTWKPARTVAPPQGRLSAQMIEPIRVTEVIKPVKLTSPKPGVYLYDFGQNMAGKARLLVSGTAGSDVKMQYGELLNPDGTLNQNNINPYCQSGEFQTDHYILKGSAKEVWESRFMYHGFQYVQVTGFPGEPKPENLEALVMHTDLRSAGSFECSNPLLNKIQHCTRWSYLNNFYGYPMDCPNRERNGWTGDAHLASQAGLYNFDAAAAYTQWLQDIKDEQRENGDIPGIVPTGGWGYEKWGGPAWSSAYLLIPWYMYLQCGDVRILEEHFDGMKRYVDSLQRTSNDFINGTGIGDWFPAKTQTPVDVTSTGYYYVDAVIVSKAAAILGKNDEAEKYATLAGSIKDAFNRKFLNRQTMQFANGSQTAQSCALYQGLVEPADVAPVLANLIANVTANHDHLDCGILGAKYLLRTLTENGRADLAYKITAQTTHPGWGAWVSQGATTLWECWDGQGTHNHVMFGDVSAWFFEALGGIRHDPAAPGFKNIIINPSIVGDLTWVKCSYDSIHGRIISNWKRDNHNLTMQVVIPPNTTATVFVPTNQTTAATNVMESGKPASRAEGVRLLRMEDRTAVFAVKSGSYIFSSTTM